MCNTENARTESEESDEVLCPRARRAVKLRERFLVAKDPAVCAIARMVVAGIDRKYDLHPNYKSLVKASGQKEAEEHIRVCVEIPGATDVIQTEMSLGGVGLFGGLSEDGQEFIFYEWSFVPSSKYRIHMTHQQARDIVSGKQKIVEFKLCTKAYYAAQKRARDRHERARVKSLSKFPP